MKAIGNVTASNYTYFVSLDNKFSFLERTHLEQEYPHLQQAYLWPISRLDTNGAYHLATQFLAAALMDVKALDRDCKVHIDALTPEGKRGEHFVPVYWVYWVKPEKEGRGPEASVELFAPSRTIRQLRVNKSEYILRKPLEITNIDFLLSQTNEAIITNVTGGSVLR
jgi:hypothetical protein